MSIPAETGCRYTEPYDSNSAMALLERPSAIMASTSRSLGVSVPRVSVRRPAPMVWVTTRGAVRVVHRADVLAQPEISASGRKVFGLAIAGVRLA
ncbi:hypothetical protein GCM10009734_25270 [Nonomuraea bangladeshensis]